jgi:hypothetical protein
LAAISNPYSNNEFPRHVTADRPGAGSSWLAPLFCHPTTDPRPEPGRLL